MNLEEELSLLNNNVESESNVNPVFEPAGQPQYQNQMQGQYQNNVSQNPFQNNVVPNQYQNNVPQNPTQFATQTVAQPSVVNLDQASTQTEAFNLVDTSYEVGKPVYDRNPIERLSGNAGEKFRIHLLPGASCHRIHCHYNQELNRNFVCLKDAYGTNSEPCCKTYGDAKIKMIFPVIVMPIVNGQPNSLIPNQPASLSALVLGPTQYSKLLEQVQFAGLDLNSCDIIASVDNPRFKSFNFAVAAQSFISQISNVGELTAKWKEIGTPKNLFSLAGRLISREEYAGTYANYDKSKYEQQNQVNTPIQGQMAPTSVTINTPYGGVNQGFGTQQSFGQQPFYYDNQSQTSQNSPWNF